MWIFWFRAQNPPCRCIHGIWVSLTLSGDRSCLRYHLLAKSMLPTTWKRTNSSADDSEDLFLFPDFEGSPEGYMSHPGCLNFITWTACPWIFSKNLCYMGEREISQHTDTSVLFRAADRQPTATGPAATATEIPQSSLGRALRIRELLSMQGVFAKLWCRGVRAGLQTFLNWMEKEKKAKL